MLLQQVSSDPSTGHGDSKMESQHAQKKESVDSESTYNRKQRNLTCSDVLGLIEEDESRGWGLRNTQEKEG